MSDHLILILTNVSFVTVQPTVYKLHIHRVEYITKIFCCKITEYTFLLISYI
jgi:hypothetical protein